MPVEVISYKGLSPSLQIYYRNKYQDIHDYFNNVEPLRKFVYHAKQLLNVLSSSFDDDIKLVLKKWSEDDKLILDTTLVQKYTGYSEPKCRGIIKKVAEIFRVKTIHSRSFGKSRKYRITIFELVFSRDLIISWIRKVNVKCKLSPFEVKLIEDTVIQLYREGYKFEEIVKILNKSNTYIAKIINKYKVNRRRKYTDDIINKVVELYKSGCSVRDIHKIMKIPLWKIYVILSLKNLRR